MQYSKFFITNGEQIISLKSSSKIKNYLKKHLFPFAKFTLNEHRRTTAWDIICNKNNRSKLNIKEKSILIRDDDDLLTNIFIFRLVRNLFRLEYAKLANVLFLHGGIINISNKGILYLGGKGSGKTSSILGMLSLGKEASYVCNDDAIIQFSSSIIGVGSARSISIRKNTLSSLKSVIPVDNLGADHPSNRLPSEQQYLTLYPGQISSVLGCNLLQTTPIHAIVFPEITSKNDFQINAISCEETLNNLVEHLSEPIDARHSFLQPLIGKLKNDHLIKKLSMLSSFTVSHPLTLVKESAKSLWSMLNE